MKIKETPHFSYLIGKLPEGCSMCVRGEKLVLFETGFCNNSCAYCPISEQKKNKDVTFANEMPAKRDSDIITEAKECRSMGAGITGGDPLTRVERTARHIRQLKKEFGKAFHIHLYTVPNLITTDKLAKLYKAGLDEIRIHPNIDDDRLWHKISLLKKFKWKAGMEIPVIPGKNNETKKLLDFSKDKVDFVNLNELELSETNESRLSQMGLTQRRLFAYEVKGSQEMGKRLMKYCLKKGFKQVHFCTVKLKDGVQLYNRIRRRAGNTAYSFDIRQKNGVLIRGAAYIPGLEPGFGYRKKLASLSGEERKKAAGKIKATSKKLKMEIAVDMVKLRLLMSAKNAYKNSKLLKKMGLVPAVVEEYPTYDAMELSVEFV